MLIKSEDLVTNERHKLEFSGSDILAWLPSDIRLDFTTRHRREVLTHLLTHSLTHLLMYSLTHSPTHQVLGKLLVKNLTMRYTRWGTCIIDLVNENTKVLNTAAAGIDRRKAAVNEGDAAIEEETKDVSETSDI